VVFVTMLVAWIVSTYRRKKALEAAAVELIQNQVNEGIGIVKQIQVNNLRLKPRIAAPHSLTLEGLSADRHPWS
jgi:hypothetical protein